MNTEPHKRISFLNIKKIDTAIKGLKESIEKSEKFRQKIEDNSKNTINCITFSSNSLKEAKFDYRLIINPKEPTTPSNKKVMNNGGKFAVTFGGPSKLGRNHFREKEGILPSQTNQGVSTRNTLENLNESFDNRKSNSNFNLYGGQRTEAGKSKLFKLPEMNTQSSSNINTQNYYVNTACSMSPKKKLVLNATIDKESKLISSKVFNKKYDYYKGCEKKILIKEAKLGKDLTYEKQINEIKSKIHFIKEVYNYAYPKIMIEKVRQMKRNLNESKGLKVTQQNPSNTIHLDNDSKPVTNSKILIY